MEEVLTTRGKNRAEEWAKIIQRKNESGQSSRQFCLENGISEKTYYYWSRKLRQAGSERPEPQLVGLEEEEDRAEGYLHIRCGQTRLDLPAQTDMEAVAMILRALQEQWLT